MYYFKELDELFFKRIINIGYTEEKSLIKRLCYQEISKEEYDNYIKNNPNIYIKKIIKNNITFSELYNKYYLWYIWKIINEYGATYQWITFPNNNIKTKEGKIDLFNDYLNKGNDYLAKDILNNGMYFPFIAQDENFILLGKHRFQALNNSLKEKIINKKFLMIIFPSSAFSNKELKKDKTYSLYYKTFLFTQDSFNYKTFFNKFYNFSDILGFAAHDNKNNTYPNLILNNEKLFEEFINGPEPKIN